MEKKINLPDLSYLRTIQYVLYGGIILYFGKDVFVPLSLAVLVSFVVFPVARWMEQRGVSRMTSILICVTVLMIILLGLIALMVSQVLSFIQELPVIREKLSIAVAEMSQLITESFGISSQQQSDWFSEIANRSASGFLSFARSAISTSATSLVLLILVPVYAVLILYYRHQWLRVLYRFFPNQEEEEIRELLSLSIETYYNFIKGMAVVYLIVGTLNSIGLLILGIPHAVLFGFTASILTFIPYIGIMVGSLAPITMAWITYDSVWGPLGVVGVFAFVQYLEANLIFPWAVSRRLQVNTLVTLVAIFLGGIIWGMAGLILFVPFVGILKLIADHSPRLATLSMVLGKDKSFPKEKTENNNIDENQQGMAPTPPDAKKRNTG
jgi:predicted PurR-regulated permease PerM